MIAIRPLWERLRSWTIPCHVFCSWSRSKADPHPRWIFVSALLLALVWGTTSPDAVAQKVTNTPVPDAVETQIQRDLHGADFEGKDGPLQRIGGPLVTIYREYQWHQRTKAGRPYEPSISMARVQDGVIAIDAIAQDDGRALLSDLRQMGLRNGAQEGRVVSGRLPIDRLGELAQLPNLRQALPALYKRPRPAPLRTNGDRSVSDRSVGSATDAAPGKVGETTTQGDAVLQAGLARSQFDTEGEGVVVGILSDSYDTNANASTSAADDVASGDLPGPGNPNGYTTPVNVLEDEPEESDEGRAMAQIIHDIAPAAELAFHTGFGSGRAGFASAIRNLRQQAQAGVIVDDIIFLAEAMFQDGVVAQAVEEVTADGAVYLSSAGNSGANGYGDRYEEIPVVPGRLQPTNVRYDFGGGDSLQTVTIPRGGSVQYILQWSDAYASAGGDGAEADIDFYLTDKEGNEVLASSTFDNNGSSTDPASDPIEFIEYTNADSIDADGDGTRDVTFQIGIERFDGPAPEFIRYVNFGAGSIDEYTQDDPNVVGDGPSTVYGHANTDAAIAVAASAYFLSPDQSFFPDLSGRLVNTFSSYGGIPIVRDNDGTLLPEPVDRLKPDVTGPDGVNTTFFGADSENDGFPNFFGTSAAAPHIAGVAALIRALDQTASPEDVAQQLEDTASDIRAFGFLTGPGEVGEQPISDVATLNGTNGVGPDRRSGSGMVVAPAAAREFAEITNFTADRASGGSEAVVVSWNQLEDADITGYTLQQDYVDAIPTVTAVTDTSVALESDLSYNVPLSDLSPGKYEYTLQYTRSDGSTRTVGPVSVTVRLNQTAEVLGPFPNPPQQGRATLRVTTENSQEVDVEVFDSIGRLVARFSESLQADRPQNISLGTGGAVQLDRLASGMYFVRVTGDGFSETNRLVVVK